MLQYIPLNQMSPYPSSWTRYSAVAGECVDLAPKLTGAFYFKYLKMYLKHSKIIEKYVLIDMCTSILQSLNLKYIVYYSI
jgi:hypothetical protein